MASQVSNNSFEPSLFVTEIIVGDFDGGYWKKALYRFENKCGSLIRS